MYYYLHELKGYEVRIIGLDLKQDVIDHCNRLSVAYGFDKLKFYHGDIASYDGVDHVDMVVTLHACGLRPGKGGKMGCLRDSLRPLLSA